MKIPKVEVTYLRALDGNDAAHLPCAELPCSSGAHWDDEGIDRDARGCVGGDAIVKVMVEGKEGDRFGFVKWSRHAGSPFGEDGSDRRGYGA